MLDAGAGSGKTSVLVERFVRAVLEDGIEVGRSSRSRSPTRRRPSCASGSGARLRELGADEAARATEGAFISTIHGFCARLLRAHALAAGLDPAFVGARRARGRAAGRRGVRRRARGRSAADGPGGVELIAAYTPAALRGAILVAATPSCARAASSQPALPPLPPRAGRLEAARDGARGGGRGAAARARRDRRPRRAGAWRRSTGWSAASRRSRRAERALAGRARAAGAARRQRRRADARRRARPTPRRSRAFRAGLRAPPGACASHELLDRLLRAFGERYARRKRARSGARLRGSGAAGARAAARGRGAARALPGAVRAGDGRRAAGHQRACSSS